MFTGAIGSAIYAGMASQPVATAIAAPIVMWLIKKRYVKSIQNPVARTIVGVVDSTALGAPIVLVVASVDLVVTGVTGKSIFLYFSEKKFAKFDFLFFRKPNHC